MNFSSFIVTAGLALQANPVATNQHFLDNLPVKQDIPNVPQRPSEIHKAIRRRIDHLPKPNHQAIRVLVEKIEEEHGDTVAKNYSFRVYQILYRGKHEKPGYPRNNDYSGIKRPPGIKPHLRKPGRQGGQNWKVTGAENRG